MCNCSRRTTARETWRVTYPAGSGRGTETKTTEIAAKLAAGRVPGASYEKVATP